jgi:hypothetical protein
MTYGELVPGDAFVHNDLIQLVISVLESRPSVEDHGDVLVTMVFLDTIGIWHRNMLKSDIQRLEISSQTFRVRDLF